MVRVKPMYQQKDKSYNESVVRSQSETSESRPDDETLTATAADPDSEPCCRVSSASRGTLALVSCDRTLLARSCIARGTKELMNWINPNLLLYSSACLSARTSTRIGLLWPTFPRLLSMRRAAAMRASWSHQEPPFRLCPRSVTGGTGYGGR